MKKRLLLFSLMAVVILCVSARDKTLEKFPENADPQKTGKKLTERFLASPYRNFDENPAPPPYIVYPETCAWFGALKFAAVSKDKKLQHRLEERFFPLLGKQKELMQKPNHVDNTVFGIIPLQLYMQTGNECYYHIGIDFADRQWEMPVQSKEDENYRRLLDQGLSWQTRFWIDDMFMITAIQSQAYLATKNSDYINRAAYEMTIYLDSIQQPNGLFYHAPTAPFFWCRGNGWMAAGMTDLLKHLPEDNPHRERILREYRKMMRTLKAYRNTEGLWGQLIDQEDAWTETSGSAMFTYALITGVKKGWLDASEYAPVAREAWIALMPYINEHGDLSNICIGTNISNNKQHYMNRKRLTGDFHGQAAILWCAAGLIEK